MASWAAIMTLAAPELMGVVRVHACATFPYGLPSPLHDLARALRADDKVAFERVVTLVLEALRPGIPGLAGPDGLESLGGPDGHQAFAVALPGHMAGSANASCERLIARLADELDWLHPAPRSLVRVADAPEGKAARDRDAAAEAGTLRWVLDRLGQAGPVLLLDDVVRTGSSLAAAVIAAPPGLATRLVPVAVFRATL